MIAYRINLRDINNELPQNGETVIIFINNLTNNYTAMYIEDKKSFYISEEKPLLISQDKILGWIKAEDADEIYNDEGFGYNIEIAKDKQHLDQCV